MLRRFPSARRTAVRGFGSAFTLAIALAGGAAVVTAATAAPAAAQRGGRNATAMAVVAKRLDDESGRRHSGECDRFRQPRKAFVDDRNLR